LVEKQVIGVFESYIRADFAKCFKCGSDVNLRLAFEEPLVTGLSKTQRGIDYGLRERVVWDASVIDSNTPRMLMSQT
jgi:hypothetical protein